MDWAARARPAHRPHWHGHKLWRARLRKPVGFPMDRSVSVQLPAGEYELLERDDIHYELYASPEFSVTLRVTELDRLRESGAVVISGAWP